MKNVFSLVERVTASAFLAHISNWNPPKAALENGLIPVPSSALSCHHRAPLLATYGLPSIPDPFGGSLSTAEPHMVLAAVTTPPSDYAVDSAVDDPDRPYRSATVPAAAGVDDTTCPTRTHFWTYIAPSLLNLLLSQPLQPDEKHHRRRYRRKSRERETPSIPSYPGRDLYHRHYRTTVRYTPRSVAMGPHVKII